MSILNTILLQSSPSSGSSMSGIVMIIAMVVIFYFFMIRPQQKQRKQLQKQRDAMKSGDKVVTAGGIQGVLRSTGDNILKVEIAKGVIIRISKDSIYPFVEEQPKQGKKEEKEGKEKEEKSISLEKKSDDKED